MVQETMELITRQKGKKRKKKKERKVGYVRQNTTEEGRLIIQHICLEDRKKTDTKIEHLKFF